MDNIKELTTSKYVICILNNGYPASLEVRKVYQIIPDSNGLPDGFVRVIDESGEDYLYPEQFFMPIELPEPIKEALSLIA